MLVLNPNTLISVSVFSHVCPLGALFPSLQTMALYSFNFFKQLLGYSVEPLHSMLMADVLNSLCVKEFLNTSAIGSRCFFIYNHTLDEHEDDAESCISVYALKQNVHSIGGENQLYLLAKYKIRHVESTSDRLNNDEITVHICLFMLRFTTAHKHRRRGVMSAGRLT